MKEYIDRNAAEQAKPEFLNEKVEDYEKAVYAKGWNDCNTQYRENILSIPTVDAVPVVRCRECERQRVCKCGQYLGDDGYCSRGERKGGDE